MSMLIPIVGILLGRWVAHRGYWKLGSWIATGSFMAFFALAFFGRWLTS